MEHKLAYTVEELWRAKLIPVGRDNLYRWVKENLPYQRVGRRIVVARWVVELWLLGVDVKAFVETIRKRLRHADPEDLAALLYGPQNRLAGDA